MNDSRNSSLGYSTDNVDQLSMNFGRGRNFVKDKSHSPGPIHKNSSVNYGTEANSVVSVITKGGHVVSP